MARVADVPLAVDLFRYGGVGTKIEGNTIPISAALSAHSTSLTHAANRWAWSADHPVEFSMLMAAWKLPCVGDGCTVVLKPRADRCRHCYWPR